MEVTNTPPVETPVAPNVKRTYIPSTVDKTLARFKIITTHEADEKTNVTGMFSVEVDILTDGKIEKIWVALNAIDIPIETKINGEAKKVYGIEITPYPVGKLKFDSDSKDSIAAISYVMAEIFAILSTNVDFVPTPIENSMRRTIQSKFSGKRIQFFVFRDNALKNSDFKDIDQKVELLAQFTPSQERPIVVARGKLSFDTQFFSSAKIALYYDSSIEDEELKSLRNALVIHYSTKKEPVKNLDTGTEENTSAQVKEESKSILSFKQFSRRLLPESVVQELNKGIQTTVKEGLKTINYDSATGKIFTPPIVVKAPLKWDSLKTLDVTEEQQDAFDKVFNNPEYSLLVDGKNVTVTPSTFTFNL